MIPRATFGPVAIGVYQPVLLIVRPTLGVKRSRNSSPRQRNPGKIRSAYKAWEAKCT